MLQPLGLEAETSQFLIRVAFGTRSQAAAIAVADIFVDVLEMLMNSSSEIGGNLKLGGECIIASEGWTPLCLHVLE